MKTSLILLLPSLAVVLANVALPNDLGKVATDLGMIGLLFFLFMQERKERKEILHLLFKQKNNENNSQSSH